MVADKNGSISENGVQGFFFGHTWLRNSLEENGRKEIEPFTHEKKANEE
jgi:hypothetical protein